MKYIKQRMMLAKFLSKFLSKNYILDSRGELSKEHFEQLLRNSN